MCSVGNVEVCYLVVFKLTVQLEVIYSEELGDSLNVYLYVSFTKLICWRMFPVFLHKVGLLIFKLMVNRVNRWFGRAMVTRSTEPPVHSPVSLL